jgi:hypothetical protein
MFGCSHARLKEINRDTNKIAACRLLETRGEVEGVLAS